MNGVGSRLHELDHSSVDPGIGRCIQRTDAKVDDLVFLGESTIERDELRCGSVSHRFRNAQDSVGDATNFLHVRTSYLAPDAEFNSQTVLYIAFHISS